MTFGALRDHPLHRLRRGVCGRPDRRGRCRPSKRSRNADGPRYLIYEVMGERTLAMAQRIKMDDPELGLFAIPRALSSGRSGNLRRAWGSDRCQSRQRQPGRRRETRAPNREGPWCGRAARWRSSMAMTSSHSWVADEIAAIPTIEGVSIADKELVAANAYLGARPVAQALALDVDVVLVGRTHRCRAGAGTPDPRIWLGRR